MEQQKNHHYWIGREERSKAAKAHARMMEGNRSKEIQKSVEETITYCPDFDIVIPEKVVSITLDATDSVSAIFKYKEGKTAVLNFSSYKNPGGKFLEGSKAQEECLCHDSTLYNVLREKRDFYTWNNANKNKALYLNRALYSPNIVFEKDGKEVSCDVITCAAPNKTAAQKYLKVTDEENLKSLSSRIQFLAKIAADQKLDTIILGAYGCGVFGQNPKEIIELIIEFFLEGPVENLIFAVPEGDDGNYQTIKATLEDNYLV